MPDDASDDRCPTCAGEFELECHGRLEVDRCAGCGAVWFDRAELAAYARLKSAGVVGWGRRIKGDLGEAGEAQACPRCSERSLQPYQWGKLRFLRCSGCKGIHVTHDELEKFIGDTSAWAAELEREQQSDLERVGLALDRVSEVVSRFFNR